MSDKIPDLADHHIILLNKEIDAESTGEVINFILARNLMISKAEETKTVWESSFDAVEDPVAILDAEFLG